MAKMKGNLKVLVVDDFPTMRRIVKTFLRQNGYTNFVEAEDGKQAYDVLQKNPDIAFIVSDWNMPNMTGMELLRAVRSDAKFKNLPFLMVTAEGEKESVEAEKGDAINYIVKPFTGQALQDKLDKIFKIKKAG